MLKEGTIVRVIAATSDGFGGDKEYYPIGTICEVQKEIRDSEGNVFCYEIISTEEKGSYPHGFRYQEEELELV